MVVAEAAEVPFGVVTRTATAPVACAGLVAVMLVLDTTVNLVVVVPNSTAVAPLRSEPVIVTLVSPVCEPDVGESVDSAGAIDTTPASEVSP